MTEFWTTALLFATFGVLLVLCAATSRTLERLGIPIVLLFLILGMLAGTEGIAGVDFENYTYAFRLGTMALILILLDGGLNTSIDNIRRFVAPAAVLATAGVVATAALIAVFARLVGLSWSQAALLGAVVSSTDAAAVFAILRGGGLRLRRRVGTTLELEAGANDPMAVILTLTATSVILGDAPSWWLVVNVPLQLLVGLAVGLLFGLGTRALLGRIRLMTGGLYPVLVLGVALLSFGMATLCRGSGFLAVYTTAVVLGNGPLPYRNGLLRIHDAIAWLAQVTMFLMLGLLVLPSQLRPVAGIGLAIALFSAFVARPLATWLCLVPFRFPLKETAYLGWMGLRGAVPIILATFPVLSGVPGAQTIFNIVFFIVVVNAVIPGMTIRWITRRLGLDDPMPPPPLAALEINSTRLLRGELMSFRISDSLTVSGASLAQIPFPPESAAILVVRGEELVAARGSTVLRPGDHVFVFCRPADKPFIELLFGRAQEDG